MATAAFVTDITEIITQAAEAAAGIAGVVSGFKLLDVAKEYYRLYEQQRTFYYDTFQQGVESPLANEVAAIPRYVKDYVGRVDTAYNSVTGPFGGKAADARGWWDRHGSAYGALADPLLIHELEGDLARIKSDWTNYFFRMEEHVYDVNNDIRWKKRTAVHNIGIKQGTAVSGALEGATAAFQNNIQDFSSQMATYGNGIARYVGYKRGLSDTNETFGNSGYDRRPSVSLDRPIGVPDVNITQRGGERMLA